MKKPAIPSPSAVVDPAARRSLVAMKENMEIITGGVGGEIAALPSTAVDSDVIDKVNEIIRRMNRSGT